MASKPNPNVNLEPNPPQWPSSVITIRPTDSLAQIRSLLDPIQDTPHTWNDIDHKNALKSGFSSDRHFVEERYAVFLTPGVYQFDFEVGYYVQVLGLGSSADDVVFRDTTYGPYCPALNKHKIVGGRPGLSLDNFWRAAENYRTEAWEGQLWAVSQAAPLRRVHICKSKTRPNSPSAWRRQSGDLYLHDAGAYASGGHVANAIVEGVVEFGSQQQFLCRSVHFEEGVRLGAWSNVFVDCTGNVPEESVGDPGPAVTVDHTPSLTVEKPFIALKEDGVSFALHVPAPRIRENGGSGGKRERGEIGEGSAERPVSGTSGGSDLNGLGDEIRDFSNVFVARAMKRDVSSGREVSDGDVVFKINAALREGKDVVLSPGIFYLKKPIEIATDNQVVLGIGLATLVAPVDGQPCIKVPAGLEGVRIAGVMLEASVVPPPSERNFTSSLLEWGDEGKADDGNPGNPGALSDIFARVGGSNLDRKVGTDVMVTIHSGNVYGDNLWLWRADHVATRINEDPNFLETLGLDYHQVTLGECPVRTGLTVRGSKVTIHGLAVEHTTEDQVVWEGEGGTVLFYQSEFPYDVTADFGKKGFVGYRVGEGVKDHVAGGLGIYSNFRDHYVPVATAISHPTGPDRRIDIRNSFTVWLDNLGAILSVKNGKGKPLSGQTDIARLEH